MDYFFFKLIAPRPTFPRDMTQAEASIMQEHVAYWRGLMAERKVAAYGPVMDPKGTFGMAVVEAADEATALGIARRDPAITANAGFGYELHPMPDAIVRPVNQ